MHWVALDAAHFINLDAFQMAYFEYNGTELAGRLMDQGDTPTRIAGANAEALLRYIDHEATNNFIIQDRDPGDEHQ